MQFRLLTAITVFVGSYLPLSVILLVQNFDYSTTSLPFCWNLSHRDCYFPLKDPAIATSVFCICALCFAVTLVVLAVVTPRKQEISLLEAKYIPTDLMNYTLPYVVSFMSIDYQDVSKFVGLLVFLLWMFWITYKSGQVLLNPLLIVFGWRLYEIKYHFAVDAKKREHAARALSKGGVEAGETHPHIPLADILLIKPELTET